MFTSLVYDIKNKRATLRVYERLEDYALTPSFTKEEKKFENIGEVIFSGKLRKVEVNKFTNKIEFLSDTIHCEMGGFGVWDDEEYRTLICKAKEGEL